VPARGDEIYPLLFELFLPLKDGHAEIRTEAGYPMVNYRSPRAKDLAAYSHGGAELLPTSLARSR
jgi:hypothetical protein